MFAPVRMQFHNHVDGGYQTRGTQDGSSQ